jgi:hypothetical protein
MREDMAGKISRGSLEVNADKPMDFAYSRYVTQHRKEWLR